MINLFSKWILLIYCKIRVCEVVFNQTLFQINNSCGLAGGRLGCWTCGMVNGNDPMLLRYIAEGYKYEGLLEWKNLMLSMRNDIRYREIFPRQFYNRLDKTNKVSHQVDIFDTDTTTRHENYYLTYKRAVTESYSPGGMTLEGRKILLEHLLFIQDRDGHSLISEMEIQAILKAWEDTEGVTITREEITPQYFNYDGQLVFLPDKSINTKETKNQNKVFYITIELNKEDHELYIFLKNRQKINRTSLFYFPDCIEFYKHRLVWNKVTFIVCRNGINNRSDAIEHVHKWLGWRYGSFTEETKHAALNFLTLSALSEGLLNKEKNKPNSLSKEETIPLLLKEGQLAFAL